MIPFLIIAAVVAIFLLPRFAHINIGKSFTATSLSVTALKDHIALIAIVAAALIAIVAWLLLGNMFMSDNLWWIGSVLVLAGMMLEKASFLSKVGWLAIAAWIGFFSWIGPWVQSGVESVDGFVACQVDDTTPRCQAKQAADAAKLEEQHQDNLDQAKREGEVELAKRQAASLQPVPDEQVVQGINHLAGVESGLYDFLIGEPTVLNARAITLKPGQFADLALDPNRPTPRCSRTYPERSGLQYEDRPGPDRVSNGGNATWTIVAYEFAQGTTDPFGNDCPILP